MFPKPFTRYKKFELFCGIDPKFTTKKNSQLQINRKNIGNLQMKVKYLLVNKNLFITHFKQFNNTISNNMDNNSLSNLVLKKMEWS